MSYVNSAKRGWFQTYRHSYVNGVLTKVLYDAQVTKLSLRNVTTGFEEVLTLGGAAQYDLQLTRVGVGTFEWWYVPTTVGTWSVNAYWSDTVSGQVVTVKGTPAIPFPVELDPHGWVDAAGAAA